MSRYRFSVADAADDAALRARMAQDWMKGSLSLSFRREPSYFAGCGVQGEAPQVLKCIDQHDGALVGMAARMMTRVFVNGAPRRVGLLSDFRLAPQARGGTLLARGLRVFRQWHADDPVDFYLAVILDGNRRAIDTFTSGRAGFPVLRDCGRMLSPAIHLDLPRAALRVPGVQFRRARADDAAALRELHATAAPRRQFARVDYANLPGLAASDYFVAERGSRLLGCVAAWDQKDLRQTHIEAYSPWLGALRPAYNALARWLPLKPLPAPGQRIPHVYLANILLRDDDLPLWRGLLRHACNSLRGGQWHYAIAALHERDPLAAALSDYRSIASAGRLYVVHFPQDAQAAARIDQRVPYMDLARA
ncbi:MAG: hypothetical protein ABL934_10475 [Lysobacteraceae bacterium]